MGQATTGERGGRPMVMGTHFAVSSGHYLATEIGMRILQAGGNAADAAAGVGFALALLKPHQNGVGGEVPILVHSAGDGKVHAISGSGVAPAAATPERFRDLGIRILPGDGFLPATVPSAVATWILLLRRFGTMRLADVLAPSVALAERGFPMYDVLRRNIQNHATRFADEWPGSAEAFLVGAIWRNPGWAATLRRLIDAEADHEGRDAGLQAAHDAFYRGEIAKRIVEFCRGTSIRDATGDSHAGLLTQEDFAAFEARVEEPLVSQYRGSTVYKCSTWTQGAVLLQILNLLEGFNLAAMGHNSADYLHTLVECMKLAFADREYYYADPAMADVPLGRLLSKEYAADRRSLVDPRRASMDLRPGGHPPIRPKDVADIDDAFARAAGGVDGDTTKLEVIDAEGNAVSATPSGGWLMSSPVIPGMGFPLGTRAQMFSLADGHPNCIAPGKRPRQTLTPSIARLADGRLLAFGSPGGDGQDQWAAQFLLNVLEFGMSLQEAVEAPTVWSLHHPNSFYPRDARPGRVAVEGRIAKAVCTALARRGHDVQRVGDWEGGNTLAASLDPATGVRAAAASPRLEPAYAAAW
jgi:gamma-glutamyltranspeptidase/glutathione hydrolase